MAGPNERVRDLIDAVAEGDRAAMQRLYFQTAEKVYGVVLRILRRPDLAEQALVETYARVWRDAASYDPAMMDGMSWVVTIGRRSAHDLSGKRPALLGEELFEAETPVTEDEGEKPDHVISEDLRRLLSCLATLSGDLRHMVLLSHYDGWSYMELAVQFDAPAGTIRTWLLRSLEQIRDCARR